MHFDRLGGVAATRSGSLNVLGQVKREHFVGHARRTRPLGEGRPLVRHVTRLFQQFAPSRREQWLVFGAGRIAGQAGRKVKHARIDRSTILLGKHQPFIGCHSHDGDNSRNPDPFGPLPS